MNEELLLDRLRSFDGRSVEPFRQLAEELSAEPAELGRLADLAMSRSDGAVAVGTTWIIRAWLDRGTPMPPGFVDTLAELLERVTPADARLHLLQALGAVPLDPAGARRLWTAVVPQIADAHAFVRAWAYYALGLLAVADGSLRDQASELLGNADAKEKASVKVRIRKARELLGD